MTLRDTVGENWLDVDFVEHDLAIALGIVPATSNMNDYKWLYWSTNPVGTALHACLMSLARAGILEVSEDETEFRWSLTWQPPATNTPRTP